MRPEGSTLDLNHSPKQTAIPDLKAWIQLRGADFYEERTIWPPVATESWPARNIKGGTSENELRAGSDDISEETEDPRSFTQPQDNLPAQRAKPHSSVAQVAPVSPWQISVSQFDSSSTSISSSERIEKRKRISESGQDEAANLKYKCRFCGQNFPKSQALGGHMNRHRQEREHEQVKHARELLEQQDQRRASFSQIPDSPFTKFISRTPSVPFHITGTQTHQQSYLYQASPLNWNPGASQNTPYASDPDISNTDYVKPEDWTTAVLESRSPYATMFNMPYASSRGKNQDTIPGMLYERNPAQQEQYFLSDPANTTRVWPALGAGGMHRNYLQKHAGGSANAVTDRRFNPGFLSPSSYPRQLGVPGPELSGQASEAFQQFSLPSSTPASFQLLSPSSSMPADFSKAYGASLDMQSLPWLYAGSKPTPTADPIQNEPDFGLALVSDTMALEGRTTGPSPISQGTGVGQLTMEGESAQGRQRSWNNNIHGADSSSPPYGIDYNPIAEIESKYNQGLPKDP